MADHADELKGLRSGLEGKRGGPGGCKKTGQTSGDPATGKIR